jgi:hypothetical protein
MLGCQPQKQESCDMPEKALISNLTWRSLEMQKAAFPDMPHYTAPDEIPTMLRSSTRNDRLDIHVMSLGVIADDEDDFREFIELLRTRKAILHVSDIKEPIIGCRNLNIEWAVREWKASRRNAVGKIGGRISADQRLALSKAAADKIRDRWPLSNDEWPTQDLLDEAGISLNTAKRFLGRRPIEQANYAAKMKRKANREARAN